MHDTIYDGTHRLWAWVKHVTICIFLYSEFREIYKGMSMILIYMYNALELLENQGERSKIHIH
jgi:hypothetical protein